MTERVFDRSVRPDRPKSRAAKRTVAPIGFRPDITATDLNPLNQDNLNRILATVPSLDDSEIEFMRIVLQDIAASYLRQGAQPEPSRPERDTSLK